MKKITLVFMFLGFHIFYGQDSILSVKKQDVVLSAKNPLDVGELKINLDSKGDKWLRLGVNSQIWLRNIENNPGTKVNGVPQDQTYDAGIRRMRLTIQSQVTPFYAVYLQMGINNQNFISGGGSGTGANGAGKKPGLFFHDAYNEFTIIPRTDFTTGKPNKNNLYIGAGLHSWNGVSRMTNASTTKMLAADLPIFNFPTIEIADQFARQFGIFVHGDFNRINYRFSVNKPFATSNTPAVGGPAVDNNQSGKLSYAGYAFYQFFEKEATITSFLPGNNLAKKKVLNVGSGFYLNKEGTQSQPAVNVFESHDVSIFGADVYSEIPLGNKKKEMGLTLYSVFYRYNYGPDYIRMSGLINPGTADPSFTGQKALEGPGNNRVLMGTGNIWFLQAGFVLPKFSNTVKVQPFINYTLKDMDALHQKGNYYDVGTSFYFYGQNARLAVQYSSRPLYDAASRTVFDRKGELIILFHIVL
ncbi:porin [uncultured Chryseobacterium sp.]|uniref:porin n=1 Tax=uncultured Chryseobacterium sp. TaxID=259322 RepID=UPI0025D7E513|nr:porin [uncultured Chryseobacterium sp.]